MEEKIEKAVRCLFSCLGQLVNFFSFERRLMIVAKRSKEEREEERKKDNLKEN